MLLFCCKTQCQHLGKQRISLLDAQTHTHTDANTPESTTTQMILIWQRFCHLQFSVDLHDPHSTKQIFRFVFNKRVPFQPTNEIYRQKNDKNRRSSAIVDQPNSTEDCTQLSRTFKSEMVAIVMSISCAVSLVDSVSSSFRCCCCLFHFSTVWCLARFATAHHHHHTLLWTSPLNVIMHTLGSVTFLSCSHAPGLIGSKLGRRYGALCCWACIWRLTSAQMQRH